MEPNQIRNKQIRIRVTEDELAFLKDLAHRHGYKNVSEYIRKVTICTNE